MGLFVCLQNEATSMISVFENTFNLRAIQPSKLDRYKTDHAQIQYICTVNEGLFIYDDMKADDNRNGSH